MRRDTRKFYESEESIKVVKKAAKKAVLKKAKDLKILNIFVTLQDSSYGDDYYYEIMVIYDDNVSRPKKGFTVGLPGVMRDELDKDDLEPFPVFRIIPNSEYKELKTEAA